MKPFLLVSFLFTSSLVAMPPKKTVKNYLKKNVATSSSQVATIETPTTVELEEAYQFGLKTVSCEEVSLQHFFENVNTENLETILQNIEHGKGNNESKFRAMLEMNEKVMNLLKVKTFFDDVFSKTEQLLNATIRSQCYKKDVFNKEKMCRILEVLITVRKSVAQSNAVNPNGDVAM